MEQLWHLVPGAYGAIGFLYGVQSMAIYLRGSGGRASSEVQAKPLLGDK